MRVFLFLSLVLISIVPIQSSASTCSSLFVVEQDFTLSFEKNRKHEIINEALLHARIKIPKNNKHYNKILDRWNLNDSTPQRIESLAQAIVINLDKKITFTQWLREIVFKGDAIKKTVKVRADTLILKRELLDSLEIRELLRKNSRIDNYRSFNHKHFNTIKLAKLLVINSATIYFLGVPLYFPAFDNIKNLDLKDKDLDLIQIRGFDQAYRTILDNYTNELRLQRVTEHAPQIFFLSIATYIGYNYLKFESIESRYDNVTVEETIPQSHQLFIEWKKSYEERNGKKVDMMNPQDRKEWDTTVLSIYRAWADMFNEKEGRYPDLSREQDLKAWEKFLLSLQG